jgi:WD40 repeat protein
MPWHIRIAALLAFLPLTTLAADPLPEKSLTRLGTIRFHSRHVIGLAFAPDSSFLATGSSDSTVRFWNRTTGRQTQCWERFETEVNAIAFAPDGKTFATAEISTLRLRNAKTGRDLRAWDLLPLDWARVLQFSTDGRLLAVQVQATPLVVRSIEDGKEVPPPGAPFLKPTLLACSDGLQHFAGLDGEDTLHVWESRTGRVLGKLPKFPSNRVTALSASGRFVALGGVFGKHAIRLWDVVNGKELTACAGHNELLSELAFSPDESCLASAGAWDRTVRLWDVATGKKRWEFKGEVAESASGVFRFSPDCKTLAFVGGDGIPYLLDLATGQETIKKSGHRAWMTHASFLGEDGRAVTAGADRTIRVWDGATAKELHRLTRPGEIQAFACSDNGKSLFLLESRKVRLVDAVTGNELRSFNAETEPVQQIAVTRDGTLLATVLAVGQDAVEELHLWDVRTAKKSRKLEEFTGPVSAMCFSLDGRMLAAACRDRAIRIWDVQSGVKLMELVGATQGVPQAVFLAFTPDGRSLASIWHDGSYTIWETVTGHQRRQARLEKKAINTLAWSADGRLIAHAATTGVISLCDTFTGTEIACLAGHDNKVTALAFSADGRRLLSGSHDSTAVIWKVPSPSVATKLKPGEARTLIAELVRQPTAEAYVQMGRLLSAPELPRILREYLPPATKEDGTRIVELIRDLDSDSFRVRERAMLALSKYGERAWRPLRQALEGGPTLEMRRRVERLLEPEKEVPSPVVVRRQRLLELLEFSGGVEAIRVLEELAAGDPEAEMTRDAREGLARFKRRPR